MNKVLLAFAFLSLVISISDSNAQSNPDHGRLSNGQAYRIDNQGMRLSDYLAELEVTNGELKNKIAGLEEEISETNRKLNTLKSGKKVDLTTCKENAPQVATISNTQANCTEYQNKVNELNNQITSLNQEILQNARVANTPRCNYESNLNPYYQKAAQLKAELDSRPSMEELTTELERKEQIKNLTQEQKLKLQDLSAKLSETELKTKEETSKRELQIQSLSEKYDNSLKQIAKLESELNDKNQELASARNSANTARASLANNIITTSSTPQDLKTISGLKSELRSQLQRLQTQILKRKGLLDTLKSKRTGIALSIQPLVTKSGVSLDKVRVLVDSLNDEEEASQIKSDIGQISKILDDDIQTLERLIR